MPVDSYIQRMFGADLTAFADSKVLLVGAGGIGCELLKDLIMMNIGEIHVLDLDTIDLSNLNRQFLFRQKDIKHSKSKTAIQAVEYFNHKSKLYSYHGSIMDKSMFPLSFFQKFNLIYNALDNLEARFYVNRICLYLQIPLYESGTTGLKGQVQPIYPYLTECFHCIPKETPKTFPVCTIRSTPSKPVHCITWAKDFLFAQLFAESGPEDIAQPNSSEFTNEAEAEASANEVSELSDLKNLISNSKYEDESYIETIFKKVFVTDIERLLKIEELWTSREKPVPLIDEVYNAGLTGDSPESSRKYNIEYPDSLRAEDIISIFKASFFRLADRFRTGEKLEFDKDDEDTLKFVMASSNLRSILFNIPLKTEFDVKQIAGNIIPAVATTNAIMAGFSALSSVNYYIEKANVDRVGKSRMIFDSSSADKVVNSSRLVKPNPSCSACSVVKGIVKINLRKTKLADLRDAIVEKYGYEDDIEIMTLDSRLLYDYDMEENLNKFMNVFVKGEEILLINDSEEKLDLVELYLIDTDDVSKNAYVKLPDLKIPAKKVKENENETDNEDIEFDIQEQGDVKANIIVDEEDEIMEITPEKVDNKRKDTDDDVQDVSAKKQKIA